MRTDTGGSGATGGLELKGGGGFNLTQAANSVSTLAAGTGAGVLRYVNAGALTVGTVNSTGVTRTGDALINTQTGNLTLAQSINVGTGNALRLESVAGKVDQTGGTITAGTLGVNAATSINLASNNAVATTFAAKATNGNLLFKNANGYDINTVAADGTQFTLVDGVTAVAASTNITLEAGSGTVTQASGKLVRTDTGGSGATGGLELKGGGGFTLTDAGNNVSTIAGNVTGAVSFKDSGAITVGTVNTAGMTSSGFTLTSLAGGAINVNNTITTTTGGVTLVNSGTLNVAADINSDGAVSQTGAGGISTSGTRTISTTGDSISLTKALTIASGSLSIDTTSGGNSSGNDIQLSAAVTGGGNPLTLNAGSGGNVVFSASASSLSSFTITNSNNVNLAALTTTGAIDITSRGTTTLPSALNAGGSVKLSVNDLDLTSTVTGSSVQIRTATASRGTALGAASSGSLQLSSAELSSITTSGTLTIGDTAQTGAISIDGTISSPANVTGGLAIVNGVGGIAINAPITYTAGSGSLSMTANGAGNSSGAITDNSASLVMATTLSLKGGSGIGTLAKPILVTNSGGITLTASNSMSTTSSTTGDVYVSRPSSGNVVLNGFVNAASGARLKLDTTLGSIDTGTALVSSQGGLEMAANSTGGSGTKTSSITVGSGGISSNGGKLVLRAANDINVNGAVNTSNGDVVLVAGSATGMSTIYGLSAAATMPDGSTVTPASATVADAAGSLSISAKVSAGTGNIIIATSGTISETPGASGGGLQNSTSGSGTGDLVVRTFNSSSGGGTISLQNSSNPAGNLNGAVTLEARFAGDSSSPSVPSSGYAPSDIDYKSYSGLVIKGVGTGADYVGIAATQNIDLAALNIQAKNLTLIASAGNVDVNTQITNSNINAGAAGGSLNLLAAGDININAVSGTNGVSIGQGSAIDTAGLRTVTNFSHDLKLAAQGSINIQGSVYLTGDLVLRADASASETASVGALPQAGNGTGGVSIKSPNGTSTPVEVKATNIIVGAANGLTKYPVQFLTIDANAANVTAKPTVSTPTVLTDAVMTAEKKIEIYLGTGDLTLSGGTVQGTSTAGAVLKGSSSASIQAPTILIKGVGDVNESNVILNGGTVTGNNTSGGGVATVADAVLLAYGSKNIDIGGSLILKGGTSTRLGSAVVSAGATLDPEQLVITTGGNVVLEAGTGPNTNAKIVNQGEIILNISGSKPYTYTNSVLGSQTILGGGLIIIGNDTTSGLFNGQDEKITGKSLPIKVNFGGSADFRYAFDNARSSAYIQSGVIPIGFDSSLINYLIFAANEETKATRLRAGLGAGDDSSAPSCN